VCGSVSLKASVAVEVRRNRGLSSHDLGRAVRRAGAGSEQHQGHGIHNPADEGDIDVLRAWVIVDDPDGFLVSLVEEIKSAGWDVLASSLVSLKLVEPQEINAPQVSYDASSGTLTIVATPGSGDLEIDLLRTPDGIRGLMSTSSPRVEDGLFDLRRIVVERPTGGLVDEFE
jgi:hypothetical protein